MASNKTKKNNFEKVETKIEDGLKTSDFELVNTSDYKHDQKFETKPTTFLKDSLKRFKKNKSSVVAAWILGILLLLAIFVPIIDRNDVKSSFPDRVYLAPKLFNSGTGWWDGTTGFSGITCAYVDDEWVPDPDSYKMTAVSDLKINDESWSNVYNKYNRGGYAKISVDSAQTKFGGNYLESFIGASDKNEDGFDLDTNFAHSVKLSFSDDDPPTNFEYVPYRIDFVYREKIEQGTVTLRKIPLYPLNASEYSTNFDYDETIDLTTAILAVDGSPKVYKHGRVRVTLNDSDCPDANKGYGITLSSATFTTNASNEDYKKMWEEQSFTEGNEFCGRTYKTIKEGTTVEIINPKYWTCTGVRNVWHARNRTCSFKYDTYAAAFGNRNMILGDKQLKKYKEEGIIDFSTKVDPDFEDLIKLKSIDLSSLVILDESRCPIVIPEGKTAKDVIVKTPVGVGGRNPSFNYECEICYYKYLGYTSMPKYLMGTDNSGRDMFKYVFEGLRTSLLLGIITSAICFIFGLVWGAISGYFGGWTDLLMERFTDILSGLPWIVVMTLCILNLGNSFFVFALALCLTGWIGTASTTRTQFYRFKNREYILASRTLGAKDMRLIFKHILPNAMGTIITGAVLMIPGIIFSEATISYLGLGLQGLSSLGVILSANQGQLLLHPYLLIFPSVIIALLMISFNLFGNGLRDAINPTLKGEDE